MRSDRITDAALLFLTRVIGIESIDFEKNMYNKMILYIIIMQEFVAHIRASAQDLLKTIREEGHISPASDAKLKELVTQFLAGFKTS